MKAFLNYFMNLEYILEVKQWIPGTPERVFAFFSEARNLERITPPWLNFKILAQSTPEICEGTVFDYRLKIHGLPVRWQTRILEWRPGHHFVDYQARGPYRLWHHRHEFVESEGGTLMTDRVRFILPLGIIGKIFAGWWVKSDVIKIFNYRCSIISREFNAPKPRSIFIK